jgi:hypothetical protein
MTTQFHLHPSRPGLVIRIGGLGVMLLLVCACSVYADGPLGDSIATVEAAQANYDQAVATATRASNDQAQQWAEIRATQIAIFEAEYAPVERYRREVEKLVVVIMVAAIGLILLSMTVPALVKLVKCQSKARQLRQEIAENQAKAHAMWLQTHSGRPTSLPR